MHREYRLFYILTDKFCYLSPFPLSLGEGEGGEVDYFNKI